MKVCLNFGCGLHPKVSTSEETWINVDKFQQAGVDKVFNLFKVPYPWKDNSIDYIYTSHFVEHIPHSLVPYNLRPSLPWEKLRKRLLEMDGFFSFFEECYRILKPNGVIEVIGPFAWTNGAMQDPTHTRYLVQQTFGYLSQSQMDAYGGKPFDYHLHLNFEVVDPKDIGIEVPVNQDSPDKHMSSDNYENLKRYLNYAQNMSIKLTAIKHG